MRLRPYQVEAEEAIFEYFATHPDPSQNPVVAMPTGTGKSLNIGSFCKRVVQRWPNQRIMMSTHVKELIEQNADKLSRLWPGVPLGIYSAGLKRKDTSHPIIFSGIHSVLQRLKKNPHAFGRIDIILIDECHLVSPDENAAYKVVIAILRTINPHLRLVGFSATPYRLGLGMITDGGIFTDVCYDITGLRAFTRLIDEGYLAPLIPMSTSVQLDVSEVHRRGGEFIAAELQEAVAKEAITREALIEMLDAARERNHIMIFAAGIDHIEMIICILGELGHQSVGVHSKLNATTRDANIAAFLKGQVRILVNSDVLTTGFDFPALDCITLLRPTSSPGLHVQILGRGTRPFYMDGFDLDTIDGRLAAIAASPKKNCLVLDFAGNTQRLGPINDPRIPRRKGEGSGDIPIKVCGACGCLNHISARTCDNCGEPFQFEEKITGKASTVALIARDEPLVEVFDVNRITYGAHVKPGATPSLKVSYYCGVRRFEEWVCLEHTSSIRHKAQAWWKERSELEPPVEIGEALKHVNTLRAPRQIRVWVNKQYPEVLSVIF